MNTQQQREKICLMKLQTAKVLWHEGRRDATFLLLESIDDPRADSLRERMGFSADYEVGIVSRVGERTRVPLIAGAILVASSFFLMGFLLSPQIRTPLPVEVTQDASQAIPMASMGAPLSLDISIDTDLTATVLSGQPTLTALETQQNDLRANIALSSTARYRQATATADALETQRAGDN